MRPSATIPTLIVALLFAAACSENPAAVEEDEDLSVELTLSEDHVHTLSPVTFTVAARDDHGNAFTDFDTLRVESLFKGTDRWRATDLVRNGNMFMGEYTFMSSGEYHLRVAGRTHDHDHMEIMHEVAEAISVGRAHEVVGGYRVEYENFPGHVHSGDEATIRFWIMEAERDANGVRPPIANLQTEATCEDASGKRETHAPEEIEPGVYETKHTFDGAGEAHMAVSFTGKDSQEAKVDFHLNVAHGH